jgi:hypothetical protein
MFCLEGVILMNKFNKNLVLHSNLSTTTDEIIATKMALIISKGKCTPTNTLDTPLMTLIKNRIMPIVLVDLLNSSITDIENINVV